MDYKYYLALLVAVALSACGGESEDRGDGGDNDEETQHLTFSDFANEVSKSEAESADDCGVVEVGQSQLEANTCVADASVNGRAFYAVYELQGIDSNVGAAWSGNTSGEVFLWHYDSSPGGGLSDLASEIETSECINAQFSGTVDVTFENVFTCDSFESTEPGGSTKNDEPELINRFDTETYAFTYLGTGFLPSDRWRIEVEGGEVVRVQHLGDHEPNLEMTMQTAPTIRSLMDEIETCSLSDQCVIEKLEYHNSYYYPTLYFGSRGEEGFGFEVSEFEIEDETAGPCVHNYYDAVVNIDRVISSPANTEVDSVFLDEVVHDDLEMQLETSCADQPEGLCYGLSFEEETPVCSLPCGFGTEEGKWRIELSAEGYQPATVTLDASYGEREGGCPSYSDEGSHFELELDES